MMQIKWYYGTQIQKFQEDKLKIHYENFVSRIRK